MSLFVPAFDFMNVNVLKIRGVCVCVPDPGMQVYSIYELPHKQKGQRRKEEGEVE
jgi:hypothetical protein